MGYKVEAKIITEWKCVVSITTPKGVVYHSKEKFLKSVAVKESRKITDLLDAGGKVPNKDQWILRRQWDNGDGTFYDKGYAVCRACDKILIGTDFCYGGDAKHPEAKQALDNLVQLAAKERGDGGEDDDGAEWSPAHGMEANAGRWRTMTTPHFVGKLPDSPDGKRRYTLGRMSFGMFKVSV